MSKKSLLLGVIFSILIVPQITLAAWWNPLSWFNKWTFSKPTEDTKVQVLENRIEELEKKLENKVSEIATTTETIAATTTTTTPVLSPVKKTSNNQVLAPTQPTKKPVVVPRQTPPQPIVPVAPLVPVQPVRDYKALYDDLQAKYVFMRDRTVDSQITRVKEGNIQDASVWDYVKYLNDLYYKLDNLLDKVGKRIPTEFDFWKTTYDQIIYEYNNRSRNYNIALNEAKDILAIQEANKKEAEKQALLNATIDKQEKLNVVNQKIADLNAKYAKDIATARSSSGMTLEQSDAVVRNLNSQYIINYDALQAEYQQILYSS